MNRTAAEVFGIPYGLVASHLEKIKKDYPCPYLGRMCVKTSTHRDTGRIPFGVSSVWSKPAFSEERIPHIICPKRLGTKEAIREAVSTLGFHDGLELLAGVRISPLGTMDHVAVRYDRKYNRIVDSAGIEGLA